LTATGASASGKLRVQPYWAGNINVFIGIHPVEGHLARALRVCPGRLNMTIPGTGHPAPRLDGLCGPKPTTVAKHFRRRVWTSGSGYAVRRSVPQTRRPRSVLGGQSENQVGLGYAVARRECPVASVAVRRAHGAARNVPQRSLSARRRFPGDVTAQVIRAGCVGVPCNKATGAHRDE